MGSGCREGKGDMNLAIGGKRKGGELMQNLDAKPYSTRGENVLGKLEIMLLGGNLISFSQLVTL